MNVRLGIWHAWKSGLGIARLVTGLIIVGSVGVVAIISALGSLGGYESVW